MKYTAIVGLSGLAIWIGVLCVAQHVECPTVVESYCVANTHYYYYFE
jgi:hypothetical protein